ncbi:MAG: aminotransferase class V-fold PLP-dependent enzyme [Flavipsychrobacter sp.]
MSADLLQQIRALEKASSVLDPDAAKREEVLATTKAYGDQFLSRVTTTPTFIQEGYDDDALGSTDFNSSTGIKKVVDLLEQHMEHPGINTASGGHLGYIPGGGLYAAAIGDYLADVTNKYAGVFYASPGAVRIENSLIEWTGKLVGYEQGFGGNLTSGGSIANLIAVTTARDAKGIKAKDFHRTVIYTTQQAHHCVDKAIIIAGLRECVVRQVPMDKAYRMDVAALQEQINIDVNMGLQPFMVIANAGSTDVGAIDPLMAISEAARKNNLWFHVDGAYGGYFLLLEEQKAKMDGIQYADSIVLDPHKGMFLPYGTGIVLIKEMQHLKNAFAYEANYMQDTNGYDSQLSPAEVSPELSKHFRGLRMWLPLKLYGEQAFKDCLQEKVLLTKYFCQRVQEIGFELCNDPELTVVTYRYVPKAGDVNEFNKKLLELMHKDGRVFISSTNVGGKYVLRFACLSFRTHVEHVDVLIDMLEKGVSQLA